MRQGKLEILSMALNVKEEWLLGYDVPKRRGIEDIFQIPGVLPIGKEKFSLLGSIVSGELVSDEEKEVYIVADADVKAHFCLHAKGNSMTDARIFDWDIVSVRKQTEVENGEIADAVIEGHSH